MDNEETNQLPELDFGSVLEEFRVAAGDVPAAEAPAEIEDYPMTLTIPDPAATAQILAGSTDTGSFSTVDTTAVFPIAEPADSPEEQAAPAVPDDEVISPPAAEPAADETAVFTLPESDPAAAGPEAPAEEDTAELTGMLSRLLEDPAEPAQEPPAPASEAASAQSVNRTAESTDEPTVVRIAPGEEKTASEKKDEPKKSSGPIPLLRSEKLRILKKKQVAGPEKRYYELSEAGVTGLQLCILLNTILLVIAAVLIFLYTNGQVPATRKKLMIFGQVLMMLLSGLAGSQVLIDGVCDLFCFRYSISTTLCISFLACCGDAWFCLDQQRIPCCAAFILAMETALFARYQKITTEISQMDTMRKASNLTGLVKEPAYMGKRAGILRTDGEVEDFMDTYSRTPGPELFVSIYAAVALIICAGLAVIAGMLHSKSMALQIFSASMLASVPACLYISVSRPIAILEKRLHLVGSVLCGWNGVKKLSTRGVFPLRDNDFFPRGSTRLNGIKFYSSRTPAEVVSYSASLVFHAGGSLVPVFRDLLVSRNGVEYAVDEYTNYGNGGIGGIVNNESILVGSADFLRELNVEIPDNAVVSQAVYVSIGGTLAAVIAVSYARMRSVAAGILSLTGTRKLQLVSLVNDFILTESFLRSKFNCRTRRMVFLTQEERSALASHEVSNDSDVLALCTRDELISLVYPVTGSIALRRACRITVFIGILGGLLGIAVTGSLAYLGKTDMLTPANVLLYQLLWLIPSFLASETVRRV